MDKIKERFEANQINYIFEKLLTVQNHPLNQPHIDILDRFLKELKNVLDYKKVDIDYQEDIAAILFLNDKLRFVIKDQSYLDTEFYAYAKSMKYFIEDLKNRLLRLNVG